MNATEAAAIAKNVVTMPSEARPGPDTEPWPDPEPLIGTNESTPYPLNALPQPIREAVAEVNDFTQSPESMAVCSALSALSLAAQGLASVRRTEGLVGSISIFTMILAESGERKTSVDEHFIRPIREYEHAMFEYAAPEMSDYRADQRAWEAKVKGLESKITQGSKAGKSTAAEEESLRNLEQSRPSPPRVPRLLYTDATPEALGWGLSERYPSAAVFSSEAGTVLGGHGMGRESVLRNLAFYNSAWDGRKAASDRRTQESTRACPVRLTVGLAAQPDAVRQFVEGSRELARGTGFLARFLIAWPKSTQGSRLFKEAPTGWPALGAYQRRLRELLNLPVSFDESGDLQLEVLDFSPQAKQLWVQFHDHIESELSPSGAMAGARDFAAKAADNAARLAALLHIYIHGPEGKVEADEMTSATRIVAWHCTEALRFVGELALPRATSNALALEAWLLDRCRVFQVKSVARRDIQRLGPGAIRDNALLNEALDVLSEVDRARETHDGRRKLIEINPTLLEASR